MDDGNGFGGFRLTDGVAVFILVSLVAGVAVPVSTFHARESSNRIKCASNLRQIGLAIQMYANENRGAFPRTVFNADDPEPLPTEYTGVQAANPFLPGGPSPNDVSAALYLALRTQDITPDVFICPSNDEATAWDFGGPSNSKTSVSNFPGRAHLTYGYMNPYPSIAARRAGFKINFTLSSDFAIAADMGPGGGLATNVLPNASRRDMASVNSPNHGGDGQNVLYADGHVEFAASPYAGSPRPLSQQPRDNIYTFGVSSTTSAGTGVRGASQDQYDSVILPTALDGPQPPPAAFSGGALLWALRGVAVLIVAVTAVVAVRMIRAKPSQPPPAPSAT